MNSKYLFVLFFTLGFITFCYPGNSLAQDVSVTCPGGFTKQNEICVPDNPFAGGGLASSTDAQTATVKVINYALFFTGGLAVLFIIVGGFQFMTSGASPANEKKAKDTLKYAVFGLIVVLLSYAIVSTVEQLANSPGT